MAKMLINIINNSVYFLLDKQIKSKFPEQLLNPVQVHLVSVYD